MRIAQTTFAAFFVLCIGSTLAGAFDFPALTGRVVDQAGVLSGDARSDIIAESKAFEEKSGTQLVVATVSSLEGSDIETYANELFRTWKLGQADKNNGVLLLIAPNEHKVRIEVGYGLEATLTDALASAVIAGAIIPRFKNGDFSGGAEKGVDGIIDVLGGDTADWQPGVQALPMVSSDTPSIGAVIFIVLFMMFFIAVVITAIRNTFFPPGHYAKRNGRMVFVPAHASSGWSSSSSSSSDDSSSGSSDDFSGGGGSSGGGGASGSW
jgi:uncharacterized protein